MTFPKFVKFEETQEVEFGTLGIGDVFTEYGKAPSRTKTSHVDGANSVSEYWNLKKIVHSALVTIHHPLETKPLGECNPGDVVRCPEGDIGYLLHDPDDHILLRDDLVPIAMYGDHEIAAWSRRLTVTIIGKVVCDG